MSRADYVNTALWQRYEHCRAERAKAVQWVRVTITNSPEFRVACDYLLRCELDEADAYQDFRNWLAQNSPEMG